MDDVVHGSDVFLFGTVGDDYLPVGAVLWHTSVLWASHGQTVAISFLRRGHDDVVGA
jgi:hypothetical protein